MRPSQQPHVGEPLPNAELAAIPPGKLVEYALNPEHGHGGSKARVIRAALGLERADWRELRDAILAELPKRPVVAHRPATTPSGVDTWAVRVWVEGTEARAAWLMTAWKLEDDRPVLVTLYVERR